MSKSNISKIDNLYHNLNKSCYRYYNANPDSRFTDDCVLRAICTGLNKSWENVFVELNAISLDKKLVPGDERIYGMYLMSNGWKKMNQPSKSNGKKYHIDEFLEEFKGRAILHAGKNHITFVSDGYLYDIFNCEDRIVGCYWVKDEN